MNRPREAQVFSIEEVLDGEDTDVGAASENLEVGCRARPDQQDLDRQSLA